MCICHIWLIDMHMKTKPLSHAKLHCCSLKQCHCTIIKTVFIGISRKVLQFKVCYYEYVQECKEYFYLSSGILSFTVPACTMDFTDWHNQNCKLSKIKNCILLLIYCTQKTTLMLVLWCNYSFSVDYIMYLPQNWRKCTSKQGCQ